jgi:glucose-1-phosphate thymidylyltransferase
MKGILLAGGAGTRLHPVTRGISKQLLPVYDKPMIFYPLSTLMLAGIRDILLISTLQDQSAFQRLLGDGGDFGLTLSYATQGRPEGIAQALLIGRTFIGQNRVALALGDNLFVGLGLSGVLQQAVARTSDAATLLAYRVRDPRPYGVVHFDAAGRPAGIEEKPLLPRSHYAVTGLYFYPPDAAAVAATIQPSARGELEITAVNSAYLNQGRLHVERLGRGAAWLDTGTPESLMQASAYIQALQERQGVMIGCPEEVAWRLGWISDEKLAAAAAALRHNAYGQHLISLLEEGRSAWDQVYLHNLHGARHEHG